MTSTSTTPGTPSACCTAADAASVRSGWCRNSFVELVERLYMPNPAHAKALLAAYDGRGYLSRADVLKLLGRAARGPLGGWIKPINACVLDMKRGGVLPLGAVPPLLPKQDDFRSPIYAYQMPVPLLYLLWHECA